jgi:hypothetical protein
MTKTGGSPSTMIVPLSTRPPTVNSPPVKSSVAPGSTVRRVQSRVIFAGEIVRNDVTMTVLSGQQQIRTRSFEMSAEQQFRIRDVDSVGMRCVEMKNRRTNAVAALSRGPISHFALPAAPPSERERLADPDSGLRAVTLFRWAPMLSAHGAQCDIPASTARTS